MTNKYKKEIEKMNRKIYNSKSLAELKRIGKKRDLLNVDQYKRENKNILVERLIKGKQLSDESKDVLLEQAKNSGLNVNTSMNKEDILKKISSPKLTDLNEKRLRELAEKGGIPLRSQMSNKEIIERLENPTKHYTVVSLKRLARVNNIDVRRNISKPELINILRERNLITTTPIQAQESNLGVMVKNIPKELIQVVKKKARNAKEALLNFKQYIKNLKTDYITPSRLKKLNKQLEKKTKEAVEERNRFLKFKLEASAFKNYTNQYVINAAKGYGPLEFLAIVKPAIINIFSSNRNIKTILYLYCNMSRKEGDQVVIKEFGFHSKIKLILEGTDLNEIYDEMVEEIEEEIQKVQNAEGSGWQFMTIKNITLHTTRWDPINAGSYIDLPPFLKNKKAIINMKNQDNECF